MYIIQFLLLVAAFAAIAFFLRPLWRRHHQHNFLLKLPKNSGPILVCRCGESRPLLKLPRRK